MERGLYIAASGMLAEQIRQDQLANDLANASTPGYKADRTAQTSFGALLLRNGGRPVGTIDEGVATRTVTDLDPAPIRDTGEPLDFAIAGEGYFAVQTPQGVRYTRNGQFSLDANGGLVDQAGDPVLSQNGGRISASGGHIDPAQIGVFNVPNAQKQGENLFTGAAAGRAGGTVRQGALEGAGTDPTHAMVDMIASLRAFESGQKVIQAIDDTLGRAATQVGSLGGG